MTIVLASALALSVAVVVWQRRRILALEQKVLQANDSLRALMPNDLGGLASWVPAIPVGESVVLTEAGLRVGEQGTV